MEKEIYLHPFIRVISGFRVFKVRYHRFSFFSQNHFHIKAMFSSLSTAYRSILRTSSLRCFSKDAKFKYFFLKYDYVEDMEKKRTPVRPAHFKHANKYVQSGKMLLGGAFTDPLDSGFIIFL